jgi:hypothetical protein
MATKGSTTTERSARDLFSGEADYANVTEFRESLLPFVSELERNPTKRYLITRHGKPTGVFMSYVAFQALQRLVESTLADEAKKDVSQVLAEASGRMDRDYGVVVRHGQMWPARANVALEDVQAELRHLREETARLKEMVTGTGKRRTPTGRRSRSVTRSQTG